MKNRIRKKPIIAATVCFIAKEAGFTPSCMHFGEDDENIMIIPIATKKYTTVFNIVSGFEMTTPSRFLRFINRLG